MSLQNHGDYDFTSEGFESPSDIIYKKFPSGVHIWGLYSTPSEIRSFLPESFLCLLFDHEPLVIFEANGYEYILKETSFKNRSMFPHGPLFIEVKGVGKISWGCN